MTTNSMFDDTINNNRRVVEPMQLVYLEMLPQMLAASMNIETDLAEMELFAEHAGEMSGAQRGGWARVAIYNLVKALPIDKALEALDVWYSYLPPVRDKKSQNLWRDSIYPVLLKPSIAPANPSAASLKPA